MPPARPHSANRNITGTTVVINKLGCSSDLSTTVSHSLWGRVEGKKTSTSPDVVTIGGQPVDLPPRSMKRRFAGWNSTLASRGFDNGWNKSGRAGAPFSNVLRLRVLTRRAGQAFFWLPFIYPTCPYPQVLWFRSTILAFPLTFLRYVITVGN